jgi:predicted O-methyltransferase YrrM
MPWRILKYLQHLFCLKHRKGHGIHSPYLFDFISRVVFNSERMECPAWVLKEHRDLLKLSALSAGEGRRVSSFISHSSVTQKQGKLLHRIASWFRPEMMVELGTGLGLSTLYLATGSPDTPLHSIEGNTQRATFAAQLVSRFMLGPVSIHWGDMDDKLNDILPMMPGRYLAYVDGNHRYEPTVRYVRSLMERAGEEAVIVLDDIYWSRGMNRAWREIISWPECRVSIDLFHMGILLLRKDLLNTSIKIKF